MSAPRLMLTVAFSLCALSGAASANAAAYATNAPPPAPAASSGLPDGRVYEQVSPPNKYGSEAGARSFDEYGELFSVASPDGNAVAYEGTGPAADVNASGLSFNFVAERTARGWTSRSTAGRALGQNERLSVLLADVKWRDYSPDLKHFAYLSNAAEVSGAPSKGYGNVYLLGDDPLEEPVWVLRGGISSSLEEQPLKEMLGMSPDASIVYLAYQRPLLSDASTIGWGIYEYRNGTLKHAGVLPDGTVPTRALPIATATSGGTSSAPFYEGENNPASQDNQVSEDGRRLFFVVSGEIYVHEIEPDGSERSVLVSASQLPGHVGEAAPDGATLFANRTRNAASRGVASAPTYAYASPDGSHVFFQSEDRLTSGAPTALGLKTYAFDVSGESLEYLPGVALDGIVTAAKDGSAFAFVSSTGSPQELDLWSAGANGGSVTPVTQLLGGGFVGPGRMSSDQSTMVFQAGAPIAGFNNAGSEQIYSYDVKANELTCISCPPNGVSPSGSAYLSLVDQYKGEFGQESGAVNDDRGISSDGTRIFFASPDPLVSRDTNGEMDTYEWEDGKIFLISSGASPEPSLFLDNSGSGGNVFFATTQELVEGDTDAGFDVYDARIPRPGDNPLPAAVPCTGDVCQGPPSVVQLLGAPPSATFSGTENIVAAPLAGKVKGVSKRSSGSKSVAELMRSCRKLKAGHRRTECLKRARKHRAAKSTTIGRSAKRGK